MAKRPPPRVTVRVVPLKPEREEAFARAWETVLRIGREAQVTAGDAARTLGLSRRHVGYLCRAGVFPGAVKLPGSRGAWILPRATLRVAYAAWCQSREGKVGRPPGPRGSVKRNRGK